MVVGAKQMAKKKGRPPAKSDGERETVIHMKGSPQYVAWLDQIHKKSRIPKVQLFRWAMAEWAKAHGYPAPPEI
jgi:hypothetical protein